MIGAERELIAALRYCAESKIGGFYKIDHTDQICNGHLLFVYGEHARGTTLNIYVVKNIPNGKIEYSQSIKVYGVVCGQLGWTEEYGFLVNDDIIKPKIQELFEFAQNEYEMAKKRTSAKEEMRREKEAEKRQEAIAEAQLIVKGESSPIIPNDDEHCQYCGKKFDKHNVGSFDSFKGVDYLVKAKQCSYCEKITLFEYALTYLRHL